MDEAIIVAIISGLCVAIPSMWQSRKNSALMEYRLGEIEKKVDKHNSLVERVFGLEKDVKYIKAELERK